MTEDEVAILVDFHERGMQDMGLIENSYERSRQAVEQAMQVIRWMADKAIDTLNDIHHPPDEAQIEFGIKVEAEAGRLVAKAGVESHITVKLVWKKASNEQAGNHPN